MCFPSGRKFPLSRPEDALPIHPVRWGLTSGVHPPSASFRVTGGIGSSITSIGSGSGGQGVVALLEWLLEVRMNPLDEPAVRARVERKINVLEAAKRILMCSFWQQNNFRDREFTSTVSTIKIGKAEPLYVPNLRGYFRIRLTYSTCEAYTTSSYSVYRSG